MKTNVDFYDVDVESLFMDEGIDFRTEGKNISAGWLGVCCPFCGEQNHHLGVNLETKRYSCWVCSETGTLLKLIGVVCRTTYGQSHRVIDKYRGFHYEAQVRELSDAVIYPNHMHELSSKGHNYLTDRGFDSKEIEKKYHLQETTNMSKLIIGDDKFNFRHRIIIPIIMDREIVTYTGRDWTGKQDPRYKNAPLEAGTLATAECLYNLDSVVNDRMLIVEGPTDVWKLGDEAVATLGVKFSNSQVNRIVKKNLKKVVILFDENAEQAGCLLYDALYPFIDDIQVHIITDKDPGSLSSIEAHKLKWELLYN